MNPSNGDHVGDKSPPRSTRFEKGRSGNPKGRPRAKARTDPFDRVLGQPVTIREDGVERQVTAAEAFLSMLAKRALEGDGVAARQVLDAIEAARDAGLVTDKPPITVIILSFTSPNSALEHLQMARVLYRDTDWRRVKLEPWIVEAALERLGDRHLTPEQQRVVVEATRTPRKVKWPQWWLVRPSD